MCSENYSIMTEITASIKKPATICVTREGVYKKISDHLRTFLQIISTYKKRKVMDIFFFFVKIFYILHF